MILISNLKVFGFHTVRLLSRPRLKSVARASARAVLQRNDLGDFDGPWAWESEPMEMGFEKLRVLEQKTVRSN